ncbi:serine/threonine protein kinase [Xylariaceae sp. FL1651]|nr:serine/threonine protein kinase [Xylariaceae sp. FL1651]
MSRPVTNLKITEPLDSFPVQVFDHADTLERLDLSGTGLSALPDDFSRLKKLKIAFFSNCHFSVFPRQLAACPALEMVAFRSNGMTEIPEDALPPRLRWLILTNNNIGALPKSIGRCERLQKCMLAGNQIRSLPDEMAACRKLGLLRLAANRFEQLPGWLFDLPELAFFSFAGNPCSPAPATSQKTATSRLADVNFADLQIHAVAGEGASGVVSVATWNGPDQARPVAVKLFRGGITSDGTSTDEMRACIQAGAHPSLVDTLGIIRNHPEDREGLVMELIPGCAKLGLPPSMQSCTRDVFPPEARLSIKQGLKILLHVASAAVHLHQRGVAHGDIYAHNILLYDETGHAILSDLGAATIYEGGYNMEKLEVLAFAHLIDDVWSLVKPRFDEEELAVGMTLAALHRRCTDPQVSSRPDFVMIHECLKGLGQAYHHLP